MQCCTRKFPPFLCLSRIRIACATVLALSIAGHNKQNLIKGLLPELLPLLYDQTIIKVDFLEVGNSSSHCAYLDKPNSTSVKILCAEMVRLTGIIVDKSVEFSYEELSKATDEFSLSNQIGQGGFGIVYYAELRG
ncbi:unnamed protein product [Lactuca virosa]|uniref:Protein kinase domain-containing protein n=1 Tax=Lactuca virosa TaxID=75947 RepID=A0AAU9M871_9ASTR|nr:unnamed protein product [Lactuca virosa]